MDKEEIKELKLEYKKLKRSQYDKAYDKGGNCPLIELFGCPLFGFTCKDTRRRTKMRKLLLASGLLMINTLLQADAYLLVMSKDDNLCQNITSMFNKDLFEYKEV